MAVPLCIGEISDTDERLDRLEAAVGTLQRTVDELARSQGRPVALDVRPPVAVREEVVERRPVPSAPEPRRSVTVDDLATPRNLAVLGGIGVALGLAFLVSYGISQGWISEELRIALGVLFSVALMLAGARLAERRASAPALTLLVTGLVGAFLTLMGATRLYELIPAETGILLATLVGVGAGAAALRFDSEVVGLTGLGGALIAPALVEATYDTTTLAYILPAYAIAMGLVAWQSWFALYGTALTIMVSSVAAASGNGLSARAAFAIALIATVVSGFGLLRQSLVERSAPSWLPFAYGAVATILGIVGFVIVSEASLAPGEKPELPAALAEIWLYTFAALNAVVYLVLRRVGLADLGLAALSAAAAALAWGLGETFEGPALVVAWSATAALSLAGARDEWERGLALAIGALAALHLLAIDVPVEALSDGVDSVADAWIAGLAVAVVSATAWVVGPNSWKPWAAGASFAILLYLVSATIIDASQLEDPSFGAIPEVAALDSEARGQVVVSSLWALCGLGLLVAGLRRKELPVRVAGLALLGLAAAKIVLFDLAELSVAARTISFIVVGLVFLLAAFASQSLAGGSVAPQQDSDS